MVSQENIAQLLNKISDKSVDILLKYPFWRKTVIEAFLQAPLPVNYQPDIIEFFAQQGLLASQVYGYVFSNRVPADYQPQFIAIYFDSELVLFVIGSEIVLNRLTGVSVFGLFDLDG
jgi:hypothetical protein